MNTISKTDVVRDVVRPSVQRRDGWGCTPYYVGAYNVPPLGADNEANVQRERTTSPAGMGGQHAAPQGVSTDEYGYRGEGCRERFPQLFDAMEAFEAFEAERQRLAGQQQPAF